MNFVNRTFPKKRIQGTGPSRAFLSSVLEWHPSNAAACAASINCSSDLVSPRILAKYAAVEASLPSGAVALDNITDSFLLTERNGRVIFLDDWPGAASPRPGWPLTQGLDAVSAFLTRKSVRYIIYGYGYTKWFDMRSCQQIPNQAHFSQLDHELEILSFVTHHQFDQLRATRKSIYGDGKIAVIDLRSPISSHSLQPDWTLQTSEAEMCSQIAREYIKTHAQIIHRENSSCE